MEHTDEELVKRAQEGDSLSFNTLAQRYYPKVREIVSSYVPSSDIDDVVQNVFLHLTRSLCSFRGESQFYTWFRRIMMNRVADFYRRRYRNNVPTPVGLLLNAPNVNTSSNETEEDASVREHISMILPPLPKVYRDLLLSRWVDAMSITQMADCSDITYEAARSRCRRAAKVASKTIDPALLRESIVS